MRNPNMEGWTSGIFTSLLTLAFTVLKLTGYISWSWVWVLAPLWIPLALGVATFLVALLILRDK